MQRHIGRASQAILALMLLALASSYGAAADGVAIPLPAKDQEQLETLLGKGIAEQERSARAKTNLEEIGK